MDAYEFNRLVFDYDMPHAYEFMLAQLLRLRGIID